MSRPPPVFPLKPPVRTGAFRAVPPAIFPPILGLLGLGLAWRRGADAFGLPEGLAELLLGAVCLLALFALASYAAKLAIRPGVVAEDIRILPGRGGLAAGAMTVHATAAVLAPYAPRLALATLVAGLALHLGMILLFLNSLRTGPAEARDVTPVWHLLFVGPIVAALAALELGVSGLAAALLVPTLPAALAIWGVSLWQLVRRIPPAPLRPLLAIHLAPASLFAIVLHGLGQILPAAGFAALGAVILLALVASLRWIAASGFSALWGAFTFPLAAYAGALLVQGWTTAGGLTLVAATLIIPPIAVRILQDWAKGSLATRTNAAIA